MSANEDYGILFRFAAGGAAAQRAVNDICENRHKGNAESNAAFKVVKAGLTLKQSVVLKFIAQCGEIGATTDEVAAHFNSMPNEISGRMSELKRDGKIRADGRRRLTRGGCMAAVCVIV